MIFKTTKWYCDCEGCRESFVVKDQPVHPLNAEPVPSIPLAWAVIQYGTATLARCPKCVERPVSPGAVLRYRAAVIEGIVSKHGTKGTAKSLALKIKAEAAELRGKAEVKGGKPA